MINIYIIKSAHLPVRAKSIDITINKIRNMMKSQKIESNVIYITTPSVEEIEKNIEEYNKQINLTENIEDEDFKKLQNKFNLAQISNLIKHRKAYELIKNSNNKHNLIIEDDAVILDDYVNNFNDFLKIINKIEYDILFTCISNNNTTAKRIEIELSTISFKILLCKSSYFITPSTATKLYDYLQVIRFTLKNSLSKYIYDNRDNLQSYVLNKHTILEGSKIGIFSSTIHPTNPQLQNNNYIEMINLYNKFDTDETIFDEILEFYNKNGKMNPEFQHLVGLLYYKKNDYNKALEYLQDAVMNIKKKEGYIPVFNEILNNCINMHKFCQDDIKDCFNKPGIYGT
jgi:hypothetical protein